MSSDGSLLTASGVRVVSPARVPITKQKTGCMLAFAGNRMLLDRRLMLLCSSAWTMRSPGSSQTRRAERCTSRTRQVPCPRPLYAAPTHAIKQASILLHDRHMMSLRSGMFVNAHCGVDMTYRLCREGRLADPYCTYLQALSYAVASY